MILATHAVVGAAAASLVPHHPVLAFTLGFLSHFAIDAIPHWHYPVSTMEINRTDLMKSDMRIDKRFPFDLAKIGSDAAIGIAFAFLFFQSQHSPFQWHILAGAIGGIAPDPLLFLYWKFRREPLVSVARFHMWAHAKTNLDHDTVRGVSYQVALGLACALLTKGVYLLYYK